MTLKAKLLTVSIFILLIFVYYSIPFTLGESPEIFVSIATFLFAIFAGFFISRQSTRHAEIGALISKFDGNMSALYRDFEHLGKSSLKKFSKIIKNHYKTILKHKKWDYHFKHKSTTITDSHKLLDDVVKNKNLPTLKAHATANILRTLREQQKLRKNMVKLEAERIPVYQWLIIYLLAFIMFITISSVFSYQLILPSLLKAASVSSIIFVLILLHRLNSLKFFESNMGENVAQDVLNIVDGKK